MRMPMDMHIIDRLANALAVRISRAPFSLVIRMIAEVRSSVKALG